MIIVFHLSSKSVTICCCFGSPDFASCLIIVKFNTLIMLMILFIRMPYQFIVAFPSGLPHNRLKFPPVLSDFKWKVLINPQE